VLLSDGGDSDYRQMRQIAVQPRQLVQQRAANPRIERRQRSTVKVSQTFRTGSKSIVRILAKVDAGGVATAGSRGLPLHNRQTDRSRLACSAYLRSHRPIGHRLGNLGDQSISHRSSTISTSPGSLRRTTPQPAGGSRGCLAASSGSTPVFGDDGRPANCYEHMGRHRRIATVERA
jgi:hypothetical protein